MSVDLRKVKKLIELVVASGIAELEVRDGEETIRIARYATPVPASGPSAVPEAAVAETGAGFALCSPMAGTFYRAPGPEVEPFVVPGQTVHSGDVLCIIESMKMMNEIRAERSGVVSAIEVENGEAVSSGQVLFRFR